MLNNFSPKILPLMG